MNYFKFLKNTFIVFFITISVNAFAQSKLITPHVDSRLYLGEGSNQPLIVGLGGSEGGNAWDSDYWKKTRDQFIAKGYAFLALGYFGGKGTPDTLNKISINHLHDAIMVAAKNKKINKKKIAIIGGSRGGDLALLTGSFYKDIKAVIAIVPSHVAFPGHTNHFTTSAWTFNNKELPFVPVNEEAVPFLMKRDLRGAFTAMLKDSISEEKALIKVENINGPILLLSATKDDHIPSVEMCDKMIARLNANKFKHANKHIVIEGGHGEPLKHFDLIFKFLENNFSKK
ncbi:MAG: acyl-CoA thioester hydrolase/BAAT C-terminal domain-containing protein [Ferruginibacter sp.]